MKEGEVKEEPCWETSGILAEFSNKVNGAVLKFTEPADSAMPEDLWRLYPFKDDEELDTLHIH